MSLGALDKDRQVIPRWHTYPMARWLGVTASVEGQLPTPALGDDYQEKVASWEKSKRLGHASDLVGNALILNQFGDQSAIAAAQFIFDNSEKASPLLLEVAETFLRLSKNESLALPNVIVPDENNRVREVISRLKARTREYPRNPILWMDLAFYYSALGQTELADRAVTVALSLNQENRYLLRSGARFFMHLGTPDKALYYLRKSNSGQQDPWIVAAEIAITDTIEGTSQRMKSARTMLENKSYAKFHLSELASALGTIELKSGARKKGNKLFALALEEPTENTLAQITFLQNRHGEPRGAISPDRSAQSFEAEAMLKAHNYDFDGALDASKKWFAYQPFSSRPAVHGSYIAGVALGKVARMGLLSSPKDVMLKNNLAFSLASVGRVEEAKGVLEGIEEDRLSESEKNTLTATRGVISFRSEDHAEGRRLYGIAIDGFKKEKSTRLETLAKFFWAREEERIGSGLGRQMAEEAIKNAKKLDIRELMGHFEKK